MTSIPPRSDDLDSVLLDQLIDGELDEAAQRDLLVQLENTPDGWRQCALSFLEAQIWRRELRAIAPPTQTVAAPHDSAKPVAPPISTWRGRVPHYLGTGLAMAASFLLALGLGLGLRGLGTGSGSRDTLPGGSSGESPSVAAVETGRPATPAVPGAPAPGSVTLAVDNGQGGEDAFELPYMVGDSIDPHWIDSLPSPVPPEVRAALEQTGHQVQQYRQIIPLPMQDGRHLVVPVDKVQIHYVGDSSYQ